MRIVALLVLTVVCAFGAEPSLVTIYSSGCKYPCLKEALRSDVGISFERGYVGDVYDGTERLGRLPAYKYFTFRLEPGHHVFDVAKKSTKQALPVTIVAGQHYFIRITAVISHGAFAVHAAVPTLDLVDCSVAASEATKMRKVEPSKLEVQAIGKLVMTPGFPSCTSLGDSGDNPTSLKPLTQKP